MLFATLNLNHPCQLQYPISISNQNMIKSYTASQTNTSKQQSTMTLNSDFLQIFINGNNPVSRSLFFLSFLLSLGTYGSRFTPNLTKRQRLPLRRQVHVHPIGWKPPLPRIGASLLPRGPDPYLQAHILTSAQQQG